MAAFFADDARANAAFIEKWQGRVETVTNARHRGMLRVILGEMREHQRFFEQAAAGRDDLLGRALTRDRGVAKSSPRAGSATDERPTTVAIALGSNLGDRAAHLAFALGRLRPSSTTFESRASWIPSQSAWARSPRS